MNQSLKWNFNKHFVWFVLAALLLRFGILFVFHETEAPTFDEQEYNSIALNIIVHGTFGLSKDKPTAMRPPLYPLFLAGVYDILDNTNLDLVRLIQTIISVFTALLIWFLFKNMFDEKSANLGALIFLFYPSFLFFNCLILTEVLFTFFMVGCLYFLSKYFQTKRLIHLFIAGIILGLASLTRSAAYPLVLPLAITLVILVKGNRLKSVFHAFIMVTVFFLTLSPWIYRNYELFDTFVPVDTLGGLNLYIGNYAHTPYFRGVSALELTGEKAWAFGHAEELDDLNEAQRQKWAIGMAMNYMLDHPTQTTLRSILKFADFWGLERTIIAGIQKNLFLNAFGKMEKIIISIIIILGYVFVAIWGFFGLIWKLKYQRSTMDIIALILIISYSGLYAISLGHSRYHLPLIPLLMGYAAWSLLNLKMFILERRVQVFRISSILILSFILIWSYEILAGSYKEFFEYFV